MIGMLPFLSRRGMADAAAENTAIGRSRIFDNVAGLHGCGVDSRGDGPLVIDETTIRNNRAADGGGITHAGDAAIRVLRSTLNANQATNGGGLFVDANSDTTLENTTVSGNTATGAGGGALTGSKLVLVHTTVAENNAGEGGGVNNGGAGVGTGAVIPRNTIVANNPTGGNCVGPVGSEGGNLENTDSCQLRAEGDKINTDPRIGQLADNGGPTRTHALLTLSPALNNANGLPVPPGDQRSVPRPQGFAPDIGSFESTQPGCTGTLRVTANRDSWVNQGDRNKNLGTDAVMKVTSKSGGNKHPRPGALPAAQRRWLPGRGCRAADELGWSHRGAHDPGAASHRRLDRVHRDLEQPADHHRPGGPHRLRPGHPGMERHHAGAGAVHRGE